MEILAAIPVTLTMVAVVVVVGFVQWNWRFGHTDMAFEPEQASERGQWYRVFTSPVSHSSFGHMIVSILSWGGTAGLMELSIGSWTLMVLTVFLTGAALVSHALFNSLCGPTVRRLGVILRAMNGDAGNGARRMPLMSLGISTPALVWAGALASWAAIGIVAPVLAAALGSPLVQKVTAFDAVISQSLPLVESPSPSGLQAVSSLSANATMQRLARESFAASVRAIANDHTGSVTGSAALLLMPISLASITMSLSGSSVLSVTSSLLVGIMTACSGIVPLVMGRQSAFDVAQSRKVYYTVLRGAVNALQLGPETSSVQSMWTACRKVSERAALVQLTMPQPAVIAAGGSMELVIWMLPLVLALVIMAMLSSLHVRAHGRLSSAVAADRAHLVGRVQAAEAIAATEHAELGIQSERSGTVTGVQTDCGPVGCLMRIVIGRVLRRMCCSCVSGTAVRGGRGGIASSQNLLNSLRTAPLAETCMCWDGEGSHAIAAAIEPPSAKLPPDAIRHRERWLRARQTGLRAASGAGDDNDGVFGDNQSPAGDAHQVEDADEQDGGDSGRLCDRGSAARAASAAGSSASALGWDDEEMAQVPRETRGMSSVEWVIVVGSGGKAGDEMVLPWRRVPRVEDWTIARDASEAAARVPLPPPSAPNR